ncbi:MAG: flagellar basal body P-ring protein FlgI [Tistlia sp.]|uniref:flagellar basal body P-ring protein FlgI n=1 Tax=Tistlia sp. TaxID=3057121 RepID=UPI0034A1AA6B
MFTRLPLSILAAILVLTLGQAASAQSRIKDIADFEGIRDNMLIGYGLVVGLDGTGDDLDAAVFTRESLIGMLQRLGVNARNDDLDTENVAAVMVTANLPPFSRQGSRIDLNVSALGDATSLVGGTLLVTPLLGADGEVYAVAQGSLAVAGFKAVGAAAAISRGVATSARIANGAIVEREVGFELNQLTRVNVTLRNPDLTTAKRIADSINLRLNLPVARLVDPGTVEIQVPANYPGDTVALLTEIEQIPVQVDQIARVVIDESSGVIVMGDKVRVSQVAIAQGNLTIRIGEKLQVNQPNPFGAGETAIIPETDIEIDEDDDRRLATLPAGVTLQELVDGLNALGVGPRDMITILQAIKAAGALQAEIEVM